MKHPLHEGWSVTALKGPVPEELRDRRVPAEVPGCVTTDLLAAGLLSDPYLDANEEKLAWIGRTDWRFETTFDASAAAPGERVDLVCEGLDTLATISLNGQVVATTANMHRSYRFDVSRALVSGQNMLQVTFQAPVHAAERLSEELGPRPHVGAHPFNAVRKMACNYGWDWGPDLPTVGIWRPIHLERWTVARLASVRPLVDVEVPGVSAFPAGQASPGALGESAERPWADHSAPVTAPGRVEVHVDLERQAAETSSLVVTAEVAGSEVSAPVPAGATSVVLEVAVPAVELWWPSGYGNQRLYPLRVSLSGGGEDLGSWEAEIGFRRIELDTGRDDRGARLGFVVNGRAISVRGANWIPNDCFVSGLTPESYRQRLQDGKDANINLLRVWGGGIYESEAFYRAADQLGLMVWQDFLLACAAYAEEQPLRGEIEAEAREAVTRLSRHPSLAAWSGCNENIWGHEDWGWKQQLGELTWGAGYYFELFPSIVAELDPSRPYMAGSPWSLGYDTHPNDPRFGSMHVWDVWNQKDYSHYRDYQPQFVAEYGYQGPPAWSTLTRSITARPLSPAMPEVLVHQKAYQGMEKLANGLAAHIQQPDDFEDWHWATSLNQARAVTVGTAYWRSLSPRCRGTIIWQLNDCWPVISWAAVDGDGRYKPLWYAIKQVYADRLLTIQPAATDEPDALAVVAVNDGASPWSLSLEISRQSFDGDVLAKVTTDLSAAPGHSASLPVPAEVAAAEDPSRELLVVSDGQYRALWFYREDKDLQLPPPSLHTTVERVAGGYDVTLNATSLQRDVALLADKVDPDAVADDMLLTLLAGERRRIRIRTERRLDEAALVGPAVLRSANQLRR